MYVYIRRFHLSLFKNWIPNFRIYEISDIKYKTNIRKFRISKIPGSFYTHCAYHCVNLLICDTNIYETHMNPHIT